MGQEIVPELEQTVLVDCGKGRDKMLFEGRDRAFGRIYSVIVGGDEVDVHVVAPDVGFNCLGALVVHDIECGCISTGVKVCEDVFESGNHCSISPEWYGTDKDGIEVINIGHKHILHVAE